MPWRKFWKTAPNGTQARPIFLQNPGPADLPIHTTRDRGLVLYTQPGTPGWLCCWRRTRTAGAVPEPGSTTVTFCAVPAIHASRAVS